MVQHRRTFLQHLYELPHVYNFLEEVVFSIQRRPACPTTEQKRKSLRKKKKNFGDLWKNIFRIVTQPREQSQTSTSRTNAWQEAFGKCSMPNRNPSRTHSPKARGRSWHRKIYGQTVLEKNLCKKKAVSRRWKFFRRLIKKNNHRKLRPWVHVVENEKTPTRYACRVKLVWQKRIIRRPNVKTRVLFLFSFFLVKNGKKWY